MAATPKKYKQPWRRPVPTDKHSTRTSVEQTQVEQHILQFYKAGIKGKNLQLMRNKHVPWLLRGLRSLPEGLSRLDCSRTWLAYWILNALELLGWRLEDQDMKPKPEIRSSSIVDWISRCFVDDKGGGGGYGGGPNQMAHLAPTYAAVNALCIVGTKEAYDSIPREKLHQWFLRLKTPECGFRVHIDGEIDVRASYTCLAVASLLNIMTEELTAGVADYLLRLQTYEGGIGCEPFDEAHGGYTFCGLAALRLLGAAHRLNTDTLWRWMSSRQMRLEGGFSGRSNKLVDSCYSFWVGATFPILEAVELLGKRGSALTNRDLVVLETVHYIDLNQPGTAAEPRAPPAATNIEEDADYEDISDEEAGSHRGDWRFDQTALQEYVFLCCQAGAGGLKDKPEENADYYHTLYSLAGASIAQNLHFDDPTDSATGRPTMESLRAEVDNDIDPVVVGHEANKLARISPVYNIPHHKVKRVLRYFGDRTCV